MPGAGEINGSQPFKLTIESYNRANNVANGGARANAPAALNNAEPAAAPQPAVAQAQQPKKGFFAWIMSWFRSAEPAPVPEPRVSVQAQNVNPPQVPPHKRFNDNIMAEVIVNNFAKLPQPFQDALKTLEGELRQKFGTTIVPEGKNLCELLPSAKCNNLQTTVDAANAAEREITADEIVAEYKGRADQLFAERLVGEKFAALCSAANVSLGGSTPLSQGRIVMKRYPEIAQDLRVCRTSAELTQVLDEHAEKLSALVETKRAINEATATAENSCHEKLATALGMNKCLVSSMVETVPLRYAIMELGNKILAGTAPGSKEPGFSAQEALGKVSDDFVNARTGYLAEIDSLDGIDDGVKQRWKAGVLNASSVPVMRPEQMKQLAGAVNLGKLEGALGGGLPLALRSGIFISLNRELCEAMRSVLGEAEFKKLGGEELFSLTSFTVDIALSGKPELLQKVKDAKVLLRDEVGPDMSMKNNTGGTYFVSSLVTLAQTSAEKPLTSEDRFRAAIEKQIDAALADSGVTNAKALADTRAAFVERGKGVLKSATTLAELSNYIDSLKEEAPKLAKLLDTLIKTRTAAKENIANTIAGATGLGNGFVLNNINTSCMTSDSGKLRLLYLDVMADVKNGKAIDYKAMEDKANGSVAGYANAKADMLKNIDKAGFEPADRVNYLMMVLKNDTLKAPAVVSAAKDLAENHDIKSAFKSIVELTKPEVAETLDNRQLGVTFKILAKAFQIQIQANHKEATENIKDSSDAQQFLQMMLISQLSKEFPELTGNLAKLSNSGRLVQISEELRLEMEDLKTLQTDYSMLEQYGDNMQAGYRDLMHHPTLVYDQAKHTQCLEDYSTLNLASLFFGAITKGLPSEGTLADVDKFVANRLKGGEIVKKYSEGLSNEAIPILQNLVNRLDWRRNNEMESEAIVKDFVEDLKNWRDIVPGSADSEGLEKVLQRRMNEYMGDLLNGQVRQSTFENVAGMEIFSTFGKDVSRGNTYVLNGKKMQIKGTAEMIGEFKRALGNDPAKLKAVSILLNQQIFGELTTAVPNRVPLAGWKPGQGDEDIASIKNIEKFASRDINKTGCPFFDAGSMTFEIDVAPDGNSAKIRAKTESPMRGDISLMEKGLDVGKCVITQEFTLEFGNKPTIKDLKIGQTLV